MLALGAKGQQHLEVSSDSSRSRHAQPCHLCTPQRHMQLPGETMYAPQPNSACTCTPASMYHSQAATGQPGSYCWKQSSQVAWDAEQAQNNSIVCTFIQTTSWWGWIRQQAAARGCCCTCCPCRHQVGRTNIANTAMTSRSKQRINYAGKLHTKGEANNVQQLGMAARLLR